MRKKIYKIKDMPSLMTGAEVSRVLGVPEPTLIYWKKKGISKLPYIEIGDRHKRIRYKKEDVLKYYNKVDALYHKKSTNLRGFKGLLQYISKYLFKRR